MPMWNKGKTYGPQGCFESKMFIHQVNPNPKLLVVIFCGKFWNEGKILILSDSTVSSFSFFAGWKHIQIHEFCKIYLVRSIFRVTRFHGEVSQPPVTGICHSSLTSPKWSTFLRRNIFRIRFDILNVLLIKAQGLAKDDAGQQYDDCVNMFHLD